MLNYNVKIKTSISEFVEYYNDDDDDIYTNSIINEMSSLLNIELDVCKIYKDYFESKNGTGDVFVFYSNDSNDKYFVFNTYRYVTDQLDLIEFGIGCKDDNKKVIRELVRKFYDKCQFQIQYLEGQYILEFELIKKDNYPRLIDDNHRTFCQNIYYFKCGQEI